MRHLLKIFLPYSLLIAMGVAVWLSNRQPAVDSNQTHIDPVCRMEVTPSWGFAHKHDGHDYYFCTKSCRDRFAATPSKYLGDRCVVCKSLLDEEEVKTATYLGKTYRLCGEEHRQQFKADPAAFFMHTMWGIPSWMYYVSIACVLVVSFAGFEVRERRPGMTKDEVEGKGFVPLSSFVIRHSSFNTPRINVLDSRVVRWLVTSRPFRFVLQLVVVSLFFLVIAAGLFGNQNPAMNIAPILTWTVWWGGLVILIMFAGKAWCWVCPWDAVADWMEKLRFWKKNDEGLSLNLKWPKPLRNIVIATV